MRPFYHASLVFNDRPVNGLAVSGAARTQPRKFKLARKGWERHTFQSGRSDAAGFIVFLPHEQQQAFL